jgi:hypothetical protein
MNGPLTHPPAIGNAFDLSEIAGARDCSMWVCFAHSVSNPEILRLAPALDRPLTADAVRVISPRNTSLWLIPGVEIAVHALDLHDLATGEAFQIAAEDEESLARIAAMDTDPEVERERLSELALSIEIWFHEPTEEILPSIDECRLDSVAQGKPVARFSWTPDLHRKYELSREGQKWRLRQRYEYAWAVPSDALVPLRTRDALITFSPSPDRAGTATITVLDNVLAALGLHYSAGADEFRRQSAPASANLAQQPARLATAAEAAAAWLERAAVRQTGVNRFVATAAHDPLLTLEIAFQFPGVGQAVLLTQMRDGERHRAPLTVLGHRIDFDGGVTVPSAEVAAKVASVMGLPNAYVRWAEVGAEFARTRRRMNGRTRGALHGLLQCVSDAALSPAHLFRFLFEPHGALRANRGSGAAPVVVSMESRGPNSTSLHLWWLDPAPAIDRIDVFVAGKPVEPSPKVAWDERVETVDIIDMTIDVEAPAQAQLLGSSLRIDVG